MPSIRRQILEAVANDFRGIDVVDAAGDPTDWPLKFSTVEHGPLDEGDHRKRYSVGIVPQQEKYGQLYPYITRMLPVAVEFRITINKGDSAPGLEAEDLLSVIERVILANQTWNGLAVNTTLIGNDFDMTSYSDRSVFGVVFCEIQYRHSQRDPRDPDPAAGS